MRVALLRAPLGRPFGFPDCPGWNDWSFFATLFLPCFSGPPYTTQNPAPTEPG